MKPNNRKCRFNGKLRFAQYAGETERESVERPKTLLKYNTQSVHRVCSMNTFIQVLFGLTEVLTVLQCLLKSPYTISQIYSLRNIFPMASRFPHRSGLSCAPVCVPVYALGLTDRSQPIQSSACSADALSLSLNIMEGVVTTSSGVTDTPGRC